MMFAATTTMPVDFASALFLYGPLGIFCGWLMWREVKQEERRERRYEQDRQLAIQQEVRREARHEETQKEIRMQRFSIDDLIRALVLEVLSRPELAKRAEDDARKIHEAVKSRSGT